MFEKELRIERDIFGRLRLRESYTAESMLIQLVLFVFALGIAILITLVYVPLKILISKPTSVSFWTYVIWIACFGFTAFGVTNSYISSGLNFSEALADMGPWVAAIFAILFLLNVAAFIFIAINLFRRK